MEVWLFDIMPWPYRQWEIPHPFPGSMYDRKLGKELYDGHLALYKRADELGYDGVCFAEHHYGTNSVDPSPNLMAAAVATHTSNAKIITLGNCLPMHGHPIRLAEELAMIDVLSGGRLVSGFIRGGGGEYWAYSVDIEKGRSMFNEAAELIVKAWTAEEPFAWHGEHYHYDVVSILPRPMQLPHPPIIVAANSAESLEWAAERRYPLMTSFSPTDQIAETFGYYRQCAREQYGWTPQAKDCGVSRQVYVAATDAKAREEVEEHAACFYNMLAAPAKQAQMASINARRYSERSFAYKSRAHEHMPHGEAAVWDRVQRDGLLIAGSPDTVIRKIREQQEALGVGIFMTYLPFGSLEPKQAMRSLDLFAKEVLPVIKKD
ncbi:MAG TPA: LLM class flavin-dependent oxidoreductase [Chloroflexota bacterium]|nr:LLM class flavin-dependent oxidoreductase [Chloroflexota bacterium]